MEASKDLALAHDRLKLKDDFDVPLLEGDLLFLRHYLNDPPRFLIGLHFSDELILFDAKHIGKGANALDRALVGLILDCVLLAKHLTLAQETHPKSLDDRIDIFALLRLILEHLIYGSRLFHMLFFFNNYSLGHLKFTFFDNVNHFRFISFVIDYFISNELPLFETV